MRPPSCALYRQLEEIAAFPVRSFESDSAQKSEKPFPNPRRGLSKAAPPPIRDPCALVQNSSIKIAETFHLLRIFVCRRKSHHLM